MAIIRIAKPADLAGIQHVLEAADIAYPNMSYDNFWIAEIKGQICGVVQTEEKTDFIFLSALGVLPNFQKQGLATQLLQNILAKSTKNIYLYTIIPDFFRRFGFVPVNPPAFIPPRSRFDCEECFPLQCRCMVKSE